MANRRAAALSTLLIFAAVLSTEGCGVAVNKNQESSSREIHRVRREAPEKIVDEDVQAVKEVNEDLPHEARRLLWHSEDVNARVDNQKKSRTKRAVSWPSSLGSWSDLLSGLTPEAEAEPTVGDVLSQVQAEVEPIAEDVLSQVQAEAEPILGDFLSQVQAEPSIDEQSQSQSQSQGQSESQSIIPGVQIINGTVVYCQQNCENGGVCSGVNECTCAKGWTGRYCTDYVCEQSCVHGSCSGPNTCLCDDGYQGETCEQDTCAHECAHGRCTGPDECTCDVGWEGQLCRTAICNPACANGGDCEEPNVCRCKEGYEGGHCQIAICQFSCENGGFCSSPDHCTCQVGYSGRQCQTPVCDPSCLHGAVCSAPDTCDCQAGWEGPICQTPICTQECLNGGVCTEPGRCSCPSSFGGPQCQYDLYQDDGITQVQTTPAPDHSGRFCGAFGHQHYFTFDGHFYTFPGTCQYLLSGDCLSATFQVFVRNDPNCTASSQLCHREVRVHMMGLSHDLILHQGHNYEVTKGDVTLSLPSSEEGVKVEKVGDYVRVILEPEFDGKLVRVAVYWDGVTSVYVEVDEDFAGNLCGFCGNFNGNTTDEYRLRDGTFSSSRITFANSWKMTDAEEHCPNVHANTPSSCASATQQQLQEIFGICNVLIGNEAFASCHGVVDPNPYIDACVTDLCNCDYATRSDCQCEALTQYSRACAHRRIELDWRQPDLCYRGCPATMVYTECASSCPRTCRNPTGDYDCDDHCVDGCSCPEGTLWDEGSLRCVVEQECPCTHLGVEYPPGSHIPEDCNQMYCVGGRWMRTNLECGATCSIHGDPHITTFDKRYYQFAGVCQYIVAKDFVNGKFTLLADQQPCGDDDSSSCIRSVTLIVGGNTAGKVKLHQHGVLSVGHSDVHIELPYHSDDVSVRRLSSLFVEVTTNFGLTVQWDGKGRLYTTVTPALKGHTKGLCGTFNDNQNDDFTTRSGVIVANVAEFGNSWKVSADCEDQPVVTSDLQLGPCAINTQRAEYARQHCGLMSGGSFEACNRLLEPAAYIAACEYDVCQCQDGDECLCSAIAHYARECAQLGAVVNWRTDGNCVEECPQMGQVWQECGSACGSSCRYLSEPDSSCTEDCVAGCNCPPGLFQSESGACVPQEECQCFYQGEVYQTETSTVLGNQLCFCENGIMDCQERVTLSENNCTNGMEYFDCERAAPGQMGKACEETCGNIGRAAECLAEQCVSGCQCPHGLVRDGNECVLPENCRCEHNGQMHEPGQTISVDCNSCTCRQGFWSCTTKDCAAQCSMFGNSHYTTFDGHSYQFEGTCKYIIAQDYCYNQTGSFRIHAEKTACNGLSGNVCARKVTLTLQQLVIQLEHGKDVHVGPIPGSEVAYTSYKFNIYRSGFFTIIKVENGIDLYWDNATRLYVKVWPNHRGRVCGMCGNFDGNQINDFNTPELDRATTVQDFANSWKVSSSCPDVEAPTADYCALHPHREAWARRQCNIILSDTFSPCHYKVDPEPYYEACVQDSCSCDSGGDCECFCTAVAAYGDKCNTQDVHIRWRTHELCPTQCEDYNWDPEKCEWHYDPCGTSCPATCEDPYPSTCDLQCMEGCHPKCPNGTVLYNGKCIPPMDCPVTTTVLPTTTAFISTTMSTTLLPTTTTESIATTTLEVTTTAETTVRSTTPGGGGGGGETTTAAATTAGTPTGSPSPTIPPSTEATTVSTTTQSTAPPTTTPEVTTPCEHTEVCYWTSWINSDNPSIQGSGDNETLAHLLQAGSNICNHPSMIECRTSSMNPDNMRLIPVEQVNQVVTCDVDQGFLCLAEQQANPFCLDYEVRLYCCSCGGISTTTEQTTTAVPTTTTVSTTNRPTTTESTTVSTTAPPTTTETTTVSTTAPPTTTETTTVSTTAPPTTTETTTVSTTTRPTTTEITTPCQQEMCEWKEWMNKEYPNPSNPNQNETYANLRDTYDFCETPMDIQCRINGAPMEIPFDSMAQEGVTCDMESGLYCDASQLSGIFQVCYDYEIRVKCCWEECYHSTTAQPTTTQTTTVSTTAPPTTTETTTVSTTAPPTTTETTTVSTTAPPTTTETITTQPTVVTTTPCEHVEEMCEWSNWMNKEEPSGGNPNQNETYDNLRDIYEFCETPMDIECSVAGMEDSQMSLPEGVTCNLANGLVCYASQLPGKGQVCEDYQIRVKCCSEECVTPTTTGTTTTQTTTKETTFSTTVMTPTGSPSPTQPLTTETTTVSTTALPTTTETTTVSTTAPPTTTETTTVSTTAPPTTTETTTVSTTALPTTTESTTVSTTAPPTTTETTTVSTTALPTTTETTTVSTTAQPTTTETTTVSTTAPPTTTESTTVSTTVPPTTTETTTVSTTAPPTTTETTTVSTTVPPTTTETTTVSTTAPPTTTETTTVSTTAPPTTTESTTVSTTVPPTTTETTTVSTTAQPTTTETTTVSTTALPTTTESTTVSTKSPPTTTETTTVSTTAPPTTTETTTVSTTALPTTTETTTVSTTVLPTTTETTTVSTTAPPTTTETTTVSTTAPPTTTETTTVSTTAPPTTTETTTVSTTVLPTTTETTTVSTTAPPTTTETITTQPTVVTTTPCEHVEEMCEWSNWMNKEEPSGGNPNQNETYDNLRDIYEFCETPMDIECSVAGMEDSQMSLPEGVTCDLANGLVCYASQLPGKGQVCEDYQIRVKCCSEECVTPTTTGTTTTQTTTTETTFSTTVMTPTGSPSPTQPLTTESTTVSTTALPTTTPTSCGYVCNWTDWMNSYNPSTDMQLNDKETLDNLHSQFSFCETPMGIECRYAGIPGMDFNDHHQPGVTCDVDSGLICNSSMTSEGACMDYEVRFQCCHVPESCKTTTQPTTTETTTVSTTAPPTTTETTTVSTTAPPTTTETTTVSTTAPPTTTETTTVSTTTPPTTTETTTVSTTAPPTTTETTTVSTTAPPTTTETTTVSTTALPTTTETITTQPTVVTTTPCEHVEEMCEWSNWMNKEEPSGGNPNQNETYDNLRDIYEFCETPMDIECSVAGMEDSQMSLPEGVTCDLANGLVCYASQLPGKGQVCEDYQIRVKCCSEECVTPTTTGTTTTQTTTTETTFSTTVMTPTGSPSPTQPLTTESTTVSTTALPTTTPTSCGYVCNWTDWMNSYNPSTDMQLNDKETLDNLHSQFSFCETPMGIECRYAGIPGMDFNDHHQPGVTCDVDSGLICNSSMTSEGACMDYEVRFQCCHVPESCKTTTQPTTTETTTVSTTAPPTTTETTTVSTTAPPTTTETTTVSTTAPPTTTETTTVSTTTPPTTTETTTVSTTAPPTTTETTTVSTTAPPTTTETTTVSTTAPPTTTETTTVSTTALPTTTETITTQPTVVTTTPCEHVEEMCEWSNWMNKEEPSGGNPNQNETYDNLRDIYEFCETPMDIECSVAGMEDSQMSLPEGVTCDLANGLVCYASQLPGKGQVCEDYQIRVKCCSEECVTPTTTVTTTTVLTTTEATTSITTKGTTSIATPTGSPSPYETTIVSTTPMTSTHSTSVPPPTTTAQPTTAQPTSTRAETTRPTTAETEFTTPSGLTTTEMETTQPTSTKSPPTTTETTTVSTTAPPTTTETTTVSTTAPPTTTETTTVSTTAPPTTTPTSCGYVCNWTDWMNSYNPSTDMQLNDMETLDNLHSRFSFCETPMGIECRYAGIPGMDFNDHHQPGVTCDVDSGLICNSSMTSEGACMDYEVRFQCCHVPESCKTTVEPTTTTITPTTTVTTEAPTTTITPTTTVTTEKPTTTPTTTTTEGTTTFTIPTTTSVETTTEYCQETCVWSEWMNSDYPGVGVPNDNETFAHLRESSLDFCQQPDDIECRLVIAPNVDFNVAKQSGVVCDVNSGLLCLSKLLPRNAPACYDYAIRVKCCSVPAYCTTVGPTGSPSPTIPTTQETTTVSTTALPTTTETTTVSTTALPTTTESTTVSTTAPPTTTETTTVSTTAPPTTTESTTVSTTAPPTTTESTTVSTTAPPTTTETTTVSTTTQPTTTETTTVSTTAPPTTTETTTVSTTTQPTTTAFTPPTTTECPDFCVDEYGQIHQIGDTWSDPEDRCQRTLYLCEPCGEIFIRTRTCGEVERPSCANGLQPIDVGVCCPEYQCPCECKGYGDPHYYTFDGDYFYFQGEGEFILARDTNVPHDFEVRGYNVQCTEAPITTCTKEIKVIYNGNTIELKTGHQVLVNGSQWSLPFKVGGCKVTQMGFPLKLEIQALDVTVVYDWLSSGFYISVPPYMYSNKTEGLCGPCNNNQTDDCKDREGNILNDYNNCSCDWKVETPDNPSNSCLPEPEPTATTKPPCDQSPCDVLSDPEGPFAECHDVVDYNFFYQSCRYDRRACYDECQSLGAYAYVCQRMGVCVDWRGRGNNCSFECEAGLVYKACSCVKTCENMDDFNATQCSLAYMETEGCFCPEDMVLHTSSEQCISEDTCYGCEDENGMPHAIGDTWIPHGGSCEECTCTGYRKTECYPRVCPTDQPIPKCGVCESQRMVEGSDPCCPTYECVCDLNRDDCPEVVIPTCEQYQYVHHTNPGECRPEYECSCNSSQCPSAPVCEHPKVLDMSEGECCLEYECVCDACPTPPTPYCPPEEGNVLMSSQDICGCVNESCVCRENTCSSEPECPPNKHLVTVETSCCPHYNCSCNTCPTSPPPSCSIGEVPGYVIHETVDDCGCENRSCKCDLSTCVAPPTCDDNKYLVTIETECCQEYRCECRECPEDNPRCRFGETQTVYIDDCCRHTNCTPEPVCVYQNTTHQPGTSWTDQNDNCIQCRCLEEIDPETGFYRVSCDDHSSQCDVSCPACHTYQDRSGECCGECVKTSCCVHDGEDLVEYPAGSNWTSPEDSCGRCYCTEEHGQVVEQCSSIQCPPPPTCAPGTYLESTPPSADGCCTSFSCRPAQTGSSCRLYTEEDYLRVDDCVSLQPVNITSCVGNCTSSTMYEGADLKHTCECCHEVSMSEISVPMECEGTTTSSMSYAYRQITACDCDTTECQVPTAQP